MSTSATSAALYAAVTAASSAAATPEDTKELRHHLKGKKGFTNPWDSYTEWSGPALGKAILWRLISGKRNVPHTKPPTVTVRKPDFLQSRKTKTLRATWLGHACYYVEFPSGMRILFDPVFTHRCSPFSWLGPQRYTPMPCEIDDIPIVDAVVISHSHYDHLSHPTVMKIRAKHPNVHFFAPLGNKKWFTDCGIDNMTELDWWESRDLTLSPNKPSEKAVTSTGSSSTGSSSPRKSDIAASIQATISCLPCQHTSGRTPFDKSRTLWASWSVVSGGKSVWFGGDTGYRTVPEHLPAEVTTSSSGSSVKSTPDYYHPALSHLPVCPAFSQIGRLRGPFDLGLIPIGAYDPRWLFSPMHADPKDAVNIFLDTNCRRAMGIHWGTWVLTEEDVLEPPRLLKEALSWKGVPETGVFDVCEIGESREFADAEAR